MIYLDENLNVIDNPNFETGTVEEKQITASYNYIVDIPEQSHQEVVKVYEKTGGRDIRMVVDVPEQGHWEVTDENGNLIPIGAEVPEDWPKQPITQVTTIYIYRPLTDEEIAQRKTEVEAISMETRIADLEAAVCSMYESSGVA